MNATTTVRTVLQIDADASQAAAAGRVLQRALDDRVAETLNTTLARLDETITKLAASHETLLAATEKLAKAREKSRDAAEDEARALDRQQRAQERAADKQARTREREERATSRAAEARKREEARASTPGQAIAQAAGLLGIGMGAMGAHAMEVGLANRAIGAVSGGMGIGGIGQSLSGMGGMAAGVGIGLSMAPGFQPIGLPMLFGGLLAGYLGQGLQTAQGAEQRAEAYRFAMMQAAPYFVVPGSDRLATNAKSSAIWSYGLQYGMDPMQSLQAATTLYAAAGGQMTSGTDAFRAALAAQAAGIDLGTSGGLLRTLRPGRGAEGSPADFGNVLATMRREAMSVHAGGSEIPEMIAYSVNLANEMGQRGNVLDYAQQLGASSWLSGLGFKRMRGAQTAAATTRGLGALGRSGPQNALDVAWMRAAGWQGGGGAGYFGALFKMQEPTADILGKFIKGTFGGGYFANADPDVRAGMIQRALGARGIQIGVGEARTLAQYALEGGAEGQPVAMETQGREILEKAAAGFMEVGGGIPQRRAGQTAKTIEIGEHFYDLQFKIEDMQLRAAKASTRLAPALEKLADKLDKAGDVIVKLLDKLASVQLPW